MLVCGYAEARGRGCLSARECACVVAQGVVTGERGSVGSLVWVLWWEWFHSCMGVWVRGAVNVGKHGRRGVRVQGPAGAQTRGGEAMMRGDVVALKRVQGECVGVWVSGGGGGVGARWVQQGVEEPVLAWLRGCKVTCGWVDAREAQLRRLDEVGSGEITAARKRGYKGRWERVHVVAGVLCGWKAWVRRVDAKLEGYKSAGGRRMRLRFFSHSRVHLRSNAPDRHTTINQGNSPRSK
jgi:hypothetical protein